MSQLEQILIVIFHACKPLERLNPPPQLWTTIAPQSSEYDLQGIATIQKLFSTEEESDDKYKNSSRRRKSDMTGGSRWLEERIKWQEREWKKLNKDCCRLQDKGRYFFSLFFSILGNYFSLKRLCIYHPLISDKRFGNFSNLNKLSTAR